MTWLHQTRGRHAGAEIWVIGCGPSLDDYPDDFFDDKIAIAGKFAYFRFPDSTYGISSYHSKGAMAGWLQGHREVLKKFIITVRTSYTGDLHRFGSEFRDAIYMRVWPERSRGPVDAVADAIATGQPHSYPGVDTIVHFAIQAAAVWGAKRIILSGCEHKATKEKLHAERGGIGEAYRTFYGGQTFRMPEGGFLTPEQIRAYSICTEGTKWFAEALGRNGVEVVRHFYDRGYEEI